MSDHQDPHQGYEPRDEDERKDQRRGRVPRFAVSIVATVAVGILIVLGVALAWARQQDAEDRSQCARTVQVRDDNRAMWEWLINAVDPQNRLVDVARAELDERLPRLMCTAGHDPVPIP